MKYTMTTINTMGISSPPKAGLCVGCPAGVPAGAAVWDVVAGAAAVSASITFKVLMCIV
jgi:hypothetical protein